MYNVFNTLYLNVFLGTRHFKVARDIRFLYDCQNDFNKLNVTLDMLVDVGLLRENWLPVRGLVYKANSSFEEK